MTRATVCPVHEDLVGRLAGRPFALLGVNCDGEVATAREAARARGMTWPSWQDGAEGPVAARLGVRSFPATFVIDHTGVVPRVHPRRPRRTTDPGRVDHLNAR